MFVRRSFLAQTEEGVAQLVNQEPDIRLWLAEKTSRYQAGSLRKEDIRISEGLAGAGLTRRSAGKEGGERGGGFLTSQAPQLCEDLGELLSTSRETGRYVLHMKPRAAAAAESGNITQQCVSLSAPAAGVTSGVTVFSSVWKFIHFSSTMLD